MYFLNFMKNSYEANLNTHKRCFSELDSIKYQLNVVTEYKNRLDKLLIETQKRFDVEKERHKEIMDSCLAMKQQSAICQSQFEDLQYECKKMKVDLENFKREREKLKPT
ncbi:uncharacterized protein LOC110999285 isoform X2 [Pieris rapae]|nr:uncharacterized protein LOC110999285 isoform X2 [Pieris rapae]